MALALVAGATASVVIEKLISTAVSYVQECGAGTSATQDEIQRLQQASLRIRTILDLVERGQTVSTKQSDVLDDWLWLLRDAVDQAEDVLDEMEYYELEKAVQAEDNKVQQGIVPSLKRKYDNFAGKSERNLREKKFGEKLREAMKALDHVAASSETILQLVSQLYNSDVKRQQEIEIRNARETSSILIDDKIYGRDTESKTIVDWLTKPTSDEPESSSATVGNVSAFAIVGMGGIGKTTLAKSIYNNEEVQRCFDLVMWVCVSDQFDVAMLTRKILEAAKVLDSLGDKSLNTIQEILKEKLNSNKFLLVLDDVWTDKILEWENLVAPLKFGQKGSKILLTTRMDLVANTARQVLGGKKEEPLKLSGLIEDDFRLLFNEHAFAGENIRNYRDLELIGEQIAKKLGGCPLAAKILGGYLNSSMDEKHWRRILNENFLNLQESEGSITMILRLSYHHLPASLQSCFRYCSIFPKDHKFQRNELIHMWIGSGLIKKPTHGNRSLEDIGEEYLNHLVRKSFFDIKIIDRKQSYVMHDLLHDLAQIVSSGECLGIEGYGSTDIPKTIRHIYVNRVNSYMVSNFNNRFVNWVNPPMVPDLKNLKKLKNLRTLIIHLNGDSDAVVFNEVLKWLKSLRFLQVSTDNCKLLDEVGNLIHLRCLFLSARSFLPQSVCRLHHLEVMILDDIKIDDSTLDGMSNLVKLRLLHISPGEVDEITWIGKLTSLQELIRFRVREERGYKIDQLKTLQNLRILGILDLEKLRSSEDAADANLTEKKNLDYLSLSWSMNHSGGLEIDEPVLDKLKPHTNLKTLKIEGYAGVRSPFWMTETSLPKITSINLSRCNRWEDLTPFGQLPSLKSLHLDRMQAVKKLWYSGSVGDCAFPSLRELALENMQDLELFEGEHMFPLLTKLVIFSCPRLKGLPALPVTLNELLIRGVGLTSLPMMQQDCSSSEGRASCSSSHPALSTLDIHYCPNLTSLDGFMLQQQYFPALEELKIEDCKNLRHFLNLSLLESLTIPTSLPPGVVFPKLSKFTIWNCKELSSLYGLQDLPSLEYLSIEGCYKLIEPSLLQPPIGLTSTSHTDMLLRPSMEVRIDREALLRVEPLRNLNSVSRLTICGVGEFASLDEQWLLQNRNSLRDLKIQRASSLESLPPSLIDLRSLRQLEIYDAPLLQSIPELPTSMKFLRISGCLPELEEYIDGSGKFANIPCVMVYAKPPWGPIIRRIRRRR